MTKIHMNSCKILSFSGQAPSFKIARSPWRSEGSLIAHHVYTSLIMNEKMVDVPNIHIKMSVKSGYRLTSAVSFINPKLLNSNYRADSRLAPSQWETSLQSSAVSHWLGSNLDSAPNYLNAPKFNSFLFKFSLKLNGL